MGQDLQIDNYLSWLSERGLSPTIIKPRLSAPSILEEVEKPLAVQKLGFVTESGIETPLLIDEQKLFERILTALEQNYSNTLLVQLNLDKKRPMLLPEWLAGSRVLVVLGAKAGKEFWGEDFDFESLRGKRLAHASYPSVKFIVTYHPRDLLLQPARKAQAWADLKLARALIKNVSEDCSQ